MKNTKTTNDVVEFIFEELENMKNGFPHLTLEQIYKKTERNGKATDYLML